uniref:Uncharacterized protein n=1 Tax=Tanacetum cinerariifolium TaxID=118510 RepID=A0A6L2KUR7_TANCI|nr:hypothetical protein [Tanacetum cinerariifolium]
MCLKDHLHAQERKQDKSTLETPIDFEEEILDVEVQENEAIPVSDEEITLDPASSEGFMSGSCSRGEEAADYGYDGFVGCVRINLRMSKGSRAGLSSVNGDQDVTTSNMLKEVAASLKKHGVRKADLSRLLSTEHYTFLKSEFRAPQDDGVHGDPIYSEKEGVLNVRDNKFDSPNVTPSGKVNTPEIFESSSLLGVSNNVTDMTGFDGSFFGFSNVDTGGRNVVEP